MAESGGNENEILQSGPELRAYPRPACPVCSGRLIDIRGKQQCEQCHRICETCCEGSCG